jgi:D-aminopeptidase
VQPSVTGRLDRLLETLPRAYPGPGGALAVLKGGEVLARHAWGWANAERRIPFTPRTLFQMCSVTKQFTCALLLDLFPDPSKLNADVRSRLPRLAQPVPETEHLCNMQSGLRDYWAVAMLHGAPAEAPFADPEAARVIVGTQRLQFAPGTSYSYANQNFRLLADILEERSGRAFAELLRARVFDRAGMATALFATATRGTPDGTEGYEGTPTMGFRVAENNVHFRGDAGLVASLDDMIAWERHIDATRDDSTAMYPRLSAPVRFANGAPAPYGYGLARSTEFGREVVGHGGALRGWRSHRLYARAERVSVVVIFNFLADAGGAALDVLAAVLGETRPKHVATLAAPEWLGAYVEPDTGLAAQLQPAPPGQVLLRYGHFPELLDLESDGTARNARGTRLKPADGGLWMERPQENAGSLLRRCSGAQKHDVAGRYRCAELDAELTIDDAGGALYGACSGFLGQGRMEMLDPIGGDVWMMPCRRALDHTPPGEWTLAFRRDAAEKVIGVDVGCWLARRLAYARVS